MRPKTFAISNGVNEKGFTFIEIMAVVVIISILVAFVAPRLIGRTEDAKRQAARADIEANLALALDLYALDNGGYPTTEQGLAALRAKPATPPIPENWKGPYLKKGLPKDPWGRPYLYRYPGELNKEDYDLYSYGTDGVEGGEDDIVNWEVENP
ncbi:MAG: type II secretion system major pseudopilin GspG [Candidatus Omnitrophica bacterium]|nr:type II secretion system major pseudopilin GspG [Candidatus Omnitrophota bacterium]